MKLQHLRLLLQEAAQICEAPGNAPPSTRLNTAAALRLASDRLARGDLSLPWRNEDGTFKVDQPITDLQSCGTPVDPGEGDDLVLDVDDDPQTPRRS